MSESEELAPITGRDVGILIHMIGSLQQANYRLAVKKTLQGVYRQTGSEELHQAADKMELDVALATLDSDATVGAVADWIAEHLPAPECPDGSCAERHQGRG